MNWQSDFITRNVVVTSPATASTSPLAASRSSSSSLIDTNHYYPHHQHHNHHHHNIPITYSYTETSPYRCEQHNNPYAIKQVLLTPTQHRMSSGGYGGASSSSSSTSTTATSSASSASSSSHAAKAHVMPLNLTAYNNQPSTITTTTSSPRSSKLSSPSQQLYSGSGSNIMGHSQSSQQRQQSPPSTSSSNSSSLQHSPASQLHSSSSSSLNMVAQIVDLLRQLNLKMIAFDFDYTIVSVHTGGQWLDSAEKLAEFVRPCFRELLPALMQCPDLFLCVVTYSPQEDLIRDVLRIAIREQSPGVDSLVNRIIIKGNTRDFLDEFGYDQCFSLGKELHLDYCRAKFNSNMKSGNSAKQRMPSASPNNSNSGNSSINGGGGEIGDTNILLLDDDQQNIDFARRNNHAVFQVTNGVRLVDILNFLKSLA